MNSPEFVFRPAVAADAGEMILVHYASVHTFGRGHYSDEVLAAWSPVPDEARSVWLKNLLAEESTLSGVAVCRLGRVAGFCLARPSEGLLKALYVHPDFARQSVGSELLRFIEARCRSRGLDSLELHASYNAERFYARHGYQAVGPVSQSLGATVSMGAVRMTKRLAIPS